MRTRNESRNVEQLDGDRSSSVNATAVVWFTLVREVVSYASAVNLKVSNGALRVDCCEATSGDKRQPTIAPGKRKREGLTGNCLAVSRQHFLSKGQCQPQYSPTLDVASVRLCESQRDEVG